METINAREVLDGSGKYESILRSQLVYSSLQTAE
jgi:hypothetical protein